MADSTEQSDPPDSADKPAEANKPAAKPAPAESAGNRSGDAVRVEPGDTVRRATLVERERRGGFFARWLKRLVALVVVILLLVALLLVGVTLVLKSSVPRTIAESVATGLLKLDVKLGGVDIGWGGGVTVRDVVLRLPSTDGTGAKLVEVPRIGVQLSMLPLVPIEYLTSGLPDIKKIDVERPTIYATQDKDGQWNWLQALTLATSGGSKPAEPAAGPPALPPLPNLSVWGGKLVVQNADGQTATLGEIKLDGEKHNALVYTAEGHAGDVAKFTARLLPSSGIRQEATLLVDNLAGALSPVLSLPAATLDAGWTGGFDGAAVNGVVTINSASLGAIRVARAAPQPADQTTAAAAGRPATNATTTASGVEPLLASTLATSAPATGSATRPTSQVAAALSPADRDELGEVPKGRIDVSFADGVLTLKPREIVARDVPGASGRVTLVGGTAVVGPERAAVSDLLVGLLGGQFLVESAGVDLATLSADFTTRFRNLQPAASTDLTGTVVGTLDYGKYGQPLGRLAVDAYGTVAGTGVQHLNARLTADGKNYAAATTAEKFKTLDVTLELLDSPIVLGATQESTVLPKLTGTVMVRLGENEPQPRVELAELRSLETELVRLDGGGAFYPKANPQWEEGQYWLWLEETGFPIPVPRVEGRVPLDLGIEIGGRYNPSEQEQAIQVKNIYGRLADVEIGGSGWYVAQRPPEEGKVNPPLSLLLTLTREDQIPAPPTPGGRDVVLAQQALRDSSPQAQRAAADDDKAGLSPAAAGGMGAAPEASDMKDRQEQIEAVAPIRGIVSTWLYVSGDPTAPLLNATGGLVTDGLAVGPYQLGSLNSQIEATLTGDRLIVQTPPPPEDSSSLLGAQIELRADVPFDEADPGKIHLGVANLSLSQVASAAAVPLPVDGSLDGRLDLMLQGLSLAKMRGSGEFVVSGLAVPQAYLADTLTIRPSLSDGLVSVPIELNQSFAEAPGPVFVGTSHKLALQLGYDLSRPGVVEVLNLRADDYPIAVAHDALVALGVDVHAVARLRTRAPSLTVDLTGDFPSVSGRLEGAADVLTGGKPFALSTLLHGEVETLATQSRVSLEKLTATLPGLGDVTGGGSLSLQDLPGRSQIFIHGKKIDLEAIARRLKLPDGAGGFVDFDLTLQPAPGERPKGEVLLNLAFAGDNARWRTVQIGQGQAVIYLSRTDRPNGQSSNGQFDFTVITTERMRFQVADGWVDVFAKLRDRGDGVLFLSSTVDVAGMQLAQLGPLADKPDVSGDVSLNANFFGNLTPTPRFPGEKLPVLPVDGQIQLGVTNGKLADFDVFKAILERIKFIPQKASDTLDVQLRLERDNVQLANARAVVSGAELQAGGDIKDITGGDKAELNLSVVAFLRPLGSLKIPFSESIDELLAAAQSQATALDVTGTLGKPKVAPKSFGEVGSTFKALLGGGNKGETPAESGDAP